MICEYFGKCGSCTLYNLNLEEQESLKIENSKKIFNIDDFVFFSSKDSHYRIRSEFVVWHNKDEISFAMHGIDKKEKILVNKCPKTDIKIYTLMPKLIDLIQNSEYLRFKLFGVEFLSSKYELIVTLLYHKKLDENFDIVAKKLEEILNIKIIGRSRGVKRVVSEDFIYENLNIKDLGEVKYKIYDTGFVQPNRYVNEQMISFVFNELKKQIRGDLLELYCGHGNFTLPLSFVFNRVLATEISKTSIKAANENVMLNDINNIKFIRLSAEELADAYNNKREFVRLKDINLTEYNFTHTLVDPPRAGLDSVSRSIVSKFENIIYISCNQESLKRDLDELSKTHKIVKFALFDQFPYTNHIESGVILKKI